MILLVLLLQVLQIGSCRAVVPPTPTNAIPTSTAFIASPGDLLIINGQPCGNCVPGLIPVAVNSYPNKFIDESGSTQVTVMYQANQIVTALPPSSSIVSIPQPPSSSGVLITTSFGATMTFSGSSEHAVTGAGSTMAASTGSNLSTITPGMTTMIISHKPTSTTTEGSSLSSSSSTSAATGNCTTRYLTSILAIYTITFTLFLIPVPEMDFLEYFIVFFTAATGWTILYLDTLITFARDPRAQFTALKKSIKLGLLNYATSRATAYERIRQTNKPHTQIHFGPTIRLNPPPKGMDAWWKADILNSMKKHSLQDYFNPADFTFEKYGEKLRSRASPTAKASQTSSSTVKIQQLQKGYHNKEDIFSSDEDLDTSPLENSIPMTKHRRATAPSMQQTAFPKMQCAAPTCETPTNMQAVPVNMQPGNLSAESKQTVVDDAMSPREKVSGFISWDALKRDEAAVETGGTGTGIGNVDAQRAFARMTRAETEGTGESMSSWEREALGAGV